MANGGAAAQDAVIERIASKGDLPLDEAQKTAVRRRIAADRSGWEGDLFVRVYAPPPPLRSLVQDRFHVLIPPICGPLFQESQLPFTQ